MNNRHIYHLGNFKGLEATAQEPGDNGHPNSLLYYRTKGGITIFCLLLRNIWNCFNSLIISNLLKLVISSVQSLSDVRLFVTLWIAACQASLSITNSQRLLKLMSIESVMPSSHIILCRPLLLLPPIPPSIRVFSNESTPHMRWPKY